jgi:hypothetical protein
MVSNRRDQAIADSIFKAAVAAVAKIGSSLKPKQHNPV